MPRRSVPDAGLVVPGRLDAASAEHEFTDTATLPDGAPIDSAIGGQRWVGHVLRHVATTALADVLQQADHGVLPRSECAMNPAAVVAVLIERPSLGVRRTAAWRAVVAPAVE